jgi:chorismate mutase
VELALKYGMDMIWIGARTTTNPFSVQEIANVLRGVDIPVLIKNPVCPDLELWIGAIERIRLAGIADITAIHRGFLLADNAPYRNSPLWELPLKLKMLFPELKVLCDPSHITGNRILIEEISRKAIELQMDGFFIESHIAPENALTDANQQFTPPELSVLLHKLHIRE